MSSKLLQILGFVFAQNSKDVEPPDQHNGWHGVARCTENHTIERAPRLQAHREPTLEAIHGNENPIDQPSAPPPVEQLEEAAIVDHHKLEVAVAQVVKEFDPNH
jgi:hypothetical protein